MCVCVCVHACVRACMCVIDGIALLHSVNQAVARTVEAGWGRGGEFFFFWC